MGQRDRSSRPKGDVRDKLKLFAVGNQAHVARRETKRVRGTQNMLDLTSRLM